MNTLLQIRDLNLPSRVVYKLKQSMDINNVEQLLCFSWIDLLRYLGHKDIAHIELALEKKELALRAEPGREPRSPYDTSTGVVADLSLQAEICGEEDDALTVLLVGDHSTLGELDVRQDMLELLATLDGVEAAEGAKQTARVLRKIADDLEARFPMAR